MAVALAQSGLSSPETRGASSFAATRINIVFTTTYSELPTTSRAYVYAAAQQETAAPRLRW
jgi:hypothetical protein